MCQSIVHTLPINPTKFQPILTILIFGLPGDAGGQAGDGQFCRVIFICRYSLHTLPINPAKFQPILTVLIFGLPGDAAGLKWGEADF